MAIIVCHGAGRYKIERRTVDEMAASLVASPHNLDVACAARGTPSGSGDLPWWHIRQAKDSTRGGKHNSSVDDELTSSGPARLSGYQGICRTLQLRRDSNFSIFLCSHLSIRHPIHLREWHHHARSHPRQLPLMTSTSSSAVHSRPTHHPQPTRSPYPDHPHPGARLVRDQRQYLTG